MKQRKQTASTKLVIRPQIEMTSTGFKITDPCLAMQVAKGAREMGMSVDDAVAATIQQYLATH